MEDRTEVIKHEMEEKRADLTEKLETLEQKVADELSSVKDSVTDSVASVTDNVQETIESVKEAFDVTKYVEKYPWLAVGGAVLAGFLAHEYLTHATQAPSGGPSGNGRPQAGHGTLAQVAGGVFGSFGEELKTIERFAARTALQVIGDTVKSSLSGETGSVVAGIIDRLASSLDEPNASGSCARHQEGTETAGARHPEGMEATGDRKAGMTSMTW